MVYTNCGVVNMVCFLRGCAVTAPGYFGIGIGTTAVQTSDTTLADQTTAREAIETTGYGEKYVYFTNLVNSATANGETLTEVGVFDGATTSAVMYTRNTHGDIIKTANLEVEYTVRMKFNNPLL